MGRIGYHAFIQSHAQICGGQAVIKGTRVTLRTVLATLAEGTTVAEVLRQFPTLTEEAVRAVIMFAAAATPDDQPVPPMLAL
jgi:uncharacterized protein (DUF433 family)